MSAAAVLPVWVSDPGADRLAGLGRRWTCVDGVPFGATVDVEHVLLSTAGLAVVTTAAAVPPSQHPLTEARWRARKIEFLLDPVARVPVQPVLIVPGITTFGYGMRDGVLVATTDDAVCWFAHTEGATPTVTDEQIGAMIDVLVRHTQRTDLVNASFAR
jgi:hypothetical protein